MKAVSKILAILPLLVVLLSVCSSCTTKKGKDADAQGSLPDEKTYENEFFSIKFPYKWDYEEEVNDAYDTIPTMSKGVRVTLYSTNPYAAWHTVMVQKSAMYQCFDTPEEWRDASIALKQADDQYIAVIDEFVQDSLKFGKYPAAMAGFGVVTESGDTVIQKQMVVMVGKELYYLNNSFDWKDDGTLEQIGDSILATVRFKHGE
jgi:hypothetical protein